MARPHRKTPDELMQEAMWSRRDICRIFRRDHRTIDKYINNPDPKKRLKGFMINGEFMAEKAVVLNHFKYRPYN
jgi:hypothetical protein